MSQPLRLAFFDLETAPLLAHVWRAHDNYISPDRLKHDTFLLSWALKFSDSPIVYSGRISPVEVGRRDDRRIVRQAVGLLGKADYIVAHNGDRFDIPVLNGRLLQLNEPSLGKLDTIDTLKIARRTFKVASNSLNYLARLLGLGEKHETSFELWERCYQGHAPSLLHMDRYCRQDVRLLSKVFYRMLPYAQGMPRLVAATEKGEVACIYCGSYDMERRGFRKTGAGTYQRYYCRGCGRWNRDSKSEHNSLQLRST